MRQVTTVLILTLLTTASAFAIYPEEALAPVREVSFDEVPLEQEQSYFPAQLLPLGSDIEIEEMEEVDSHIGGLLEVSEPDVSKSLDWDWVTNGNQLQLAALDTPSAKEPQPSLESGELSPYETLTISQEDKIIIGRLLMTMAENNIFKLLMEKKRLEKWGDDINHVHPVRFLGTVFTDPRLIYCMREIKRSSFKWDSFVEGFSERMREEAGRNNLVRYVEGFAEAIGRDAKDLYVYFENADFEGLVKHLLKS
jgi:hypothetical protein